MQPSRPAARGIRPGGLKSSMWASSTSAHPSSPSSSPSWSNRGQSTYTRRNGTSTSHIVPAAPQPAPEPWWENTPPPVTKGTGQRPNPNPTPATHNSASASPSASASASLSLSPESRSRDFSASQRELRRYVQIVRRMKWKLPYLQDGYFKAIGAVTPTPQESNDHDPDHDHDHETEHERQEAELHFKLDFYEYYMLLERALVHLLGVFGITVEGKSYGNDNGNGTNGTNPAGARHAYHHNVLAALEAKDSPLHHALGSGEVRRFLGRAKDLRNRWKYAEDPSQLDPEDAAVGTVAAEDGRRITGRAPLRSYDLDAMFSHIFAGFDEGYGVANAWVAEVAQRAGMVPTQKGGGQEPGAGVGGDGDGAGEGIVDMPRDEDELDFMVDAMDWEAL